MTEHNEVIRGVGGPNVRPCMNCHLGSDYIEAMGRIESFTVAGWAATRDRMDAYLEHLIEVAGNQPRPPLPSCWPCSEFDIRYKS